MHTMARKTVAAVERRFNAFLSVYSTKMLTLLHEADAGGDGWGNETSPQRKHEVYRDVKSTAEIYVR